eukprot:UN00642
MDISYQKGALVITPLYVIFMKKHVSPFRVYVYFTFTYLETQQDSMKENWGVVLKLLKAE